LVWFKAARVLEQTVVDARQDLDVPVRMGQASKNLGIDGGRHLAIDGAALKSAQTWCWSTLTAGPDTRMAKVAGALSRPMASGTTQPPWPPP
jgi:hypothetical protein